jgi:serine/threonine protein kinase/Flp pilus assembly protein TadD
MTNWDTRANDLFLQAVQLASPDARMDYLERACGGDQALRAEVEALLEANARAGSFLKAPPPGLTVTVDQPLSEQPGTVIGPYKLLQQIGEGGMGTVFLAEQTQPVQRKIALKLIKPGLDSKQIIARFEAERQALALMDHPNIAKVLDAGTTAAEPRPSVSGLGEPLTIMRGSGRPFFVMELVKGVPITRYCDERRLTPRQRLELFVPVCQAVQHAHQKGIIHRDLKPSNVLVALYDGKPVPKVIDFGVAKATGPKLTEQTLFTEFGALVGTLEYMSPEQAELNQLDIDTRSDIYSLGVLLYELLTGTTPLGRERAKDAGLLEALRIIREEETPRPSARLSTVAELPSIAANRGLEPNKLSGLVRGELDWIVMRCLEKDRGRRYESASALAQDIERYLRDEPVHACPPSLWYRFRKFARRHQAGVRAGVLLFLMAVAGLSVGGWLLWQEKERVEAARATEAEKRQLAEANVSLAMDTLDGLYLQAAESASLQEPRREKEYLAWLRAALRFYEQFAATNSSDPVARKEAGRAYRRAGDIYSKLGQHAQAEQAYGKSISLLQQVVEDFPDWPAGRQYLALSYHNLGILLKDSQRIGEAQQAVRDALALNQQLVKEFPDDMEHEGDLASNYLNLGLLLEATGPVGAGDDARRQAVELLQKLALKFPNVASRHTELAAALHNMGMRRKNGGELGQARELYEQAIACENVALSLLPRNPRSRELLCAHCLELARTLKLLGKHDEAIKRFKEQIGCATDLVRDFPGVPTCRKSLGEGHQELAELLAATGRPREAHEAAQQALACHKRLIEELKDLPAYRHRLALIQHGQAQMFAAFGRTAEAEAAYRQSLELFRKLPDASRDDVAVVHLNLGVLLCKARRFQEAEGPFQQAVDLWKKLAQGSPGVPRYRAGLAQSYNGLRGVFLNTDQLQKADEALQTALDLLEKLVKECPAVPDYQAWLAGYRMNLGIHLNRKKRFKEAVQTYRQALAMLTRLVKDFPAVSEYQRQSAGVLHNMARSLLLLGEHREAAKVAAAQARAFPNHWSGYRDAAVLLAGCMALAANDAQLSEDGRRALAQDYASQAVNMLRQALAQGYKDAGEMKNTPAFAPLRARADFQKLLAELEDSASPRN